MTLTCWRIVPAEQAATAFDGEGARLNGGRWNSIGVAMLYASEHKSLAALEVRVHIEATRKIKRYKSFAFHFDESLVEWLRTAELPQNWQQEPPPSALQQLGDDWGTAFSLLMFAYSIGQEGDWPRAQQLYEEHGFPVVEGLPDA